MSPDIFRDFLQLQTHLQTLTTLRDAFIAGPATDSKEAAALALVPMVWDGALQGKEHIELLAISNELKRYAIFKVFPSAYGVVEIAIDRLTERFCDLILAACLRNLVDWLESTLGGGQYALGAELSEAELKILGHSHWVVGPPTQFVGKRLEASESAPSTAETSLYLDLNELPDDGQEILTAGPSISPLEIGYTESAVRSGWNRKHSDFITRFEKEVSSFLGVRHAMATSSCTGALHLSLLAARIGPGDEVLVPDITWVATGSVVRYVGATPVFVDVDPLSWTINVESMRDSISPRTKAIIPVHLYGVPAQMAEIMAMAEDYGLAVIEDAAPALGAKSGNQPTGTLGDMGCFSFQGAKMLVTGEGGMLVTNDEELFSRAKKLQEHGRRQGTFWIEEVGYKYKMANLQAALGLGQVARVLNQIERKREINSWYRGYLRDIPEISFHTAGSGAFSVDWMSSIKLEGKFSFDRDRLIEHLKTVGVDSRPVFPQMSQFSIWNLEREFHNPVARDIAASAINLPSGVNLKKQTVRRVAGEIQKFFLSQK